MQLQRKCIDRYRRAMQILFLQKNQVMPNEPKSQAEHSSEDIDEENSEESDSEETTSHSSHTQNQEKTAPPLASAAVPSPATLNAHLQEWENKGKDTVIVNDALLTPLPDGAFGKRTGGEPVPLTNPISISPRKEQHSIPSVDARTVRKRLPGKGESACSDINKSATYEYQCSKCLSVDIRPVGKQLGKVPKCHSKPPEQQKNYECRKCRCRVMKRRESSTKSVRGQVRRTKRGPCSGHQSESGDEPSAIRQKRKRRRSPSVDYVTKKIKTEVLDEPITVDEKKEDSIDHFGKYVTTLLRGVPRKRCFRLQKEIISLVLEDRMRMSSDSD